MWLPLRSKLVSVVYPGPDSMVSLSGPKALEDRSKWVVSSGMGMGMEGLEGRPLQSTLVRLKLSNSP